MSDKLTFPVIAGPTASGKTALAVRLALRYGGEVVSADSMQIYADLRIGTARPTAEETGGVPHWLQGHVPLSERYSVARYLNDAADAVADIAARGKLPIFCGGTGLYIRSFLNGLRFSEEEGDPALREELQARAEREGNAVLLEELRGFDPETAARLHENDRNRILRAIEIYRATGITMSESVRRSREVPSPYRGCLIVLDARDRTVLYDRIDRRVDQMLADGLLDEAERVLRSSEAKTAMQAIGYKELAPYFAGECSLDEALDALRLGTRHYAKRQLSWFRHMEGARFLYIDDYPDAAALFEAAARVWEEFPKEAL